MPGLLKLTKAAWKVLSRPMHDLAHHPADHRDSAEEAPPRRRLRRLIRGLGLRLLLAPVLLVVVMLMLVYGTTHRVPVLADGHPVSATPMAVNVYFRDIEVTTADNVALRGWYVPAWSASQFVREGNERLLRQRRPGVVICHGAWADRSQMLHLVPALHAAGYELLLIDLRGCGESQGSTALGLDEWQDVQAAVSWLRRVGTVDPARIGVIASGPSAAAALRAASTDPSIRAVVLDSPCQDLGGFLRQRFDSIGLPGGALGRLYQWSFSLFKASDLNDASADRWARQVGPRQAVMVCARDGDPLVPGGDPVAVGSQVRGPKQFAISPHAPSSRGETALLPDKVVAFMKVQLAGPPGAAEDEGSP